jgi:3-oxoacyl-[acyl-carrier-protein] synthase III
MKHNAYIKAVSFQVPEKRVSNDELARTIDTSDEWIYEHTGIKFRHIADPDVAASDLALQPALDVLRKANLDPVDIDLILVATATPDYPGFPSTACVLQNHLKAVNAGALDITAACSGFIYGLEVAKSLVSTSAMKYILVVDTEILSKITNWTDRNTCVLFGDGAGAVIVTANMENEKSGIICSVLGAEGDGAPYLLRKAGGTRYPVKPGYKPDADLFLQMDGQKVYHFAVRVLCDTIKRILAESHLSISDISYIVPHQANKRIIKAAAKRLRIPLEKFYINIEEYANTSGASIPIALGEMDQKGLLCRGDYILTVGFGAGLTYGGNLICW